MKRALVILIVIGFGSCVNPPFLDEKHPIACIDLAKGEYNLYWSEFRRLGEPITLKDCSRNAHHTEFIFPDVLKDLEEGYNLTGNPFRIHSPGTYKFRIRAYSESEKYEDVSGFSSIANVGVGLFEDSIYLGKRIEFYSLPLADSNLISSTSINDSLIIDTDTIAKSHSPYSILHISFGKAMAYTAVDSFQFYDTFKDRIVLRKDSLGMVSLIYFKKVL